jgi:hypothetical protein
MDTTKRPASGELASRIYIELVGRAAQSAGGQAQLLAGAKEMAALSLELADAYVEVEEAVAAGKRPKTAFSLDSADVASWTKSGAD